MDCASDYGRSTDNTPGEPMANLLRIGLTSLVVAVGFLGPLRAHDSAKKSEPEDSGPSQALNAADYKKFQDWTAFLSNRNAQAYAVTGSNSIDESAYVKIGGIDQWITIRGQDR